MAMERFLGRYEPHVYAILRIIAGFLFLWHGTQKLLNFPPSPSGQGGQLSAMMAIAGVIELVGGLMIMFGLFAGFAAFIASGLMAVAYFMAHGMQAFLPIQNRGELAALYSFLFLYIAARGSGIWSLDSLMRGGSATRRVGEAT
jgi:putative oxidoreductase